MKKRFVGVAVDIDQIYGVVGYRDKKVVHIDDAFTLTCEKGLVADCNRFVSRFGLEHENIGIAYNCESATKVIPIPDLDFSEIVENLRLQIQEYIDWPENTYFYDYMQVSNELTKLLYVVALNKKVVHELSEGIIKGKGNLRIIDYWPAPIMYLYKDNDVVVVFDDSSNRMYSGVDDSSEILNDRNLLTAYAYVKGICIYSKVIKKTTVAIADVLTKIESQAITYGFDGVIKLASPERIHFDDAAEIENWEAICATYESAQERTYKLSGRAADVVDMDLKPWQVAVGLVMRNIYERAN